MNNDGNFALVRKPSSAIEKTAPRAKHILSGMVADSLALAKNAPPPRIVVVTNVDSVLQAVGAMIRRWSKDVKLLLFEHSPLAWLELSKTNPDLLVTASTMFGLRGEEIVRRLLDRKATYPIIVVSAHESDEIWVRKFASQGLNVSFLLQPFQFEDIRKLLEASLQNRRSQF